MSDRRMRAFSKVHFVGIGGAGMCGIAEVLLNLGYQVSGSDLKRGATTDRLEKLGARVFIGHDAANIDGVQVLVVSTAIDKANPELVHAKEARIPVIPRAEMLAEIMRFREGIAIAGTHGKTTTTSLTASLLAEGGLDPTFVIGGLLNSLGANARLGDGHYLVAEADESDGSFLLLQPTIAVITNIDRDHLESYDGAFDRLVDSFNDFIHRLPFYGLAILCVDDPGVRRLLPQASRNVITYGIDTDADLRALNLRQDGLAMHFDLQVDGEVHAVRLNLPGRHNVLNALAAIAVARDVGVDIVAICRALRRFKGIGRRFNDYGERIAGDKSVRVVDDYAHHPTELEATLEAARGAWPTRRLVLVFQPHRYSRTARLLDDFARVLSEADVLLVSEVYPAGESPISGADGRGLCRSIRARNKVDPIFAADLDELSDVLGGILAQGDVIVLCGAGSIGGLSVQLASQWEAAA